MKYNIKLHTVLESHLEDPMDWDNEQLFTNERYDPQTEGPILLCRDILVPDAHPVDIEYLLNFISGWQENGVTDLFYSTDSCHDMAFELIADIDHVDINDHGNDDTTVHLTEFTFFIREEGSRTACYSYSVDETNIIDDTIDMILDL